MPDTALLLESGDGFLLEDGDTGLLLESTPETLPSEAALRYHPTERRRR